MSTPLKPVRARRVPAAVVVVLVAAGVVGVRLAAGLAHSSPTVVVESGGKLRYAGSAEGPLSARTSYPETRAERFSIRVVEAEMLALGLSLVATQTLVANHAPARDAVALASGLTRLPPGIEPVAGSPGSYRSATSDLAVRYRADPVGVEICSVARDPGRDGEPLLARIDGDRFEIFVAPRPDSPLPRPLEQAAGLKSTGWMPMDAPVEFRGVADKGGQP